MEQVVSLIKSPALLFIPLNRCALACQLVAVLYHPPRLLLSLQSSPDSASVQLRLHISISIHDISLFLPNHITIYCVSVCAIAVHKHTLSQTV